MRVSIECKVEGDTLLAAEHKAEHEGTEYTFIPKEGRLASIRIEQVVPHPERFYNVFEKDASGNLVGMKGRADQDVFDAILEEFKQLESHLPSLYRLGR